MLRGVFLHCTLVLLTLASISAKADEDSKEAAVYGAFFESEVGWIQAEYTAGDNNTQILVFELEGFYTGEFFLLSLVQDGVEMEIVFLIPDDGQPPRAKIRIDASNWPMDFPRVFGPDTVFRVRDVTDAIVFEESLRLE